jgi:hypothetical protein
MATSRPAAFSAFDLLKFAVPCGLFWLFFDPAIVHPGNVGWLLRSDWGQHYLGWLAYRHTPLHWPFNREYLLDYPFGIGLIYTDSNPLVAMPLRLASWLLPADFQYIGMWFLLSLLLQFYLGWRLLGRYAPGRWARLAGATLLCTLPTLYIQEPHDTLFAQWMVLWGLFLFFEVTSERRKLAWYSVAFMVATLANPYLTMTLLAIFAGDRLRILGPLFRARQWASLARPVLVSAVPPLAAVLALAIGGGFDGSSGSNGGFGGFNMALDAPFNPVRPGFALAFLRGGHESNRTAEGFQYLGAGLLLLIAAAVVLYLRGDRRQSPEEPLGKARHLAWPYLVLLLLALSNHVQFYDWTTPRVPIPHFALGIVNIFRASGRLFWPLAYTGVFLALAMVYRAGRRAGFAVLSLAVVLQAVDLAGFAKDMRRTTSPAGTPPAVTRSAAWDAIVRDAAEVDFEPAQEAGNPSHQQLLEEIAYRAVSHNVPVNAMYTARDSTAVLASQARQFQAFVGGEVDAGRLYVLEENCGVPPALGDRVRVLDGVWMIPPVRDAGLLSERPAAPIYRTGVTFAYNEDSHDICQLDDTWAKPESGWTWSEGPRSSLLLPLEAAPSGVGRLAIEASTYDEGKSAEVFVNGLAVGAMKLGKARRAYTLAIPAGTLRAGANTITFAAEAMTEERQRSKHESRRLGIRLYTLRID